MQYLNFVSKKIFLTAVSIYGLLFFEGFLTIINKLPQQQKK